MNYENDWVPVFLLMFVIVMVGWAGYFLGHKLTDRHWRKIVPDQMYAHCMECMDLERSLSRELMRTGR